MIFNNYKYNTQNYKAADFLILLLYNANLFFHLLAKEICCRSYQLHFGFCGSGSVSFTQLHYRAADISFGYNGSSRKRLSFTSFNSLKRGASFAAESSAPIHKILQHG